MPLTREAALSVLKTIKDPASGEDIAASGMMRALQVNGGAVRFVLEIDPRRMAEMEALKTEAETKLGALEGCESVQ